ncbi:hypothetical protein NSA47_13290 [Irregularibacter muris]|uniref:Uncharacterized protein n=1 Tax=Irregularibacter muris TaxID=1796619 RepID=A0AAE3HIC6_9FIRM|nr:hypothetical protein [Irregularibacter muris]MCR1899945.1 hypothetical protein [Irregularibacter muris]
MEDPPLPQNIFRFIETKKNILMAVLIRILVQSSLIASIQYKMDLKKWSTQFYRVLLKKGNTLKEINNPIEKVYRSDKDIIKKLALMILVCCGLFCYLEIDKEIKIKSNRFLLVIHGPPMIC